MDGKKKDVVSPDGVPIGPTYQGEYFLGADGNGRDTAVRLLYGGRNSLIIGIAAALITAVLSVILGILSGFFGGVTDSVISRSMDVVWAFPVILLGVALGTALGVNGLKLGPITLAEDSKAHPDPDHRLRVRALPGPPDPGAGAGAAPEGVRRGRRGTGGRAAGGSCSARSCPT